MMFLVLAVILLLGCDALNVGQASVNWNPQLLSGKNQEALTQWQLGVAHLHSYTFGDARAAFQAARKAESDAGGFFLVTYWGEALSYFEPFYGFLDENAGKKVITAMLADKQLHPAVTPLEDKLLKIAEDFFKPGQTLADRLVQHAGYWKDLRALYPADLEIKAFTANALLAITCPSERGFQAGGNKELIMQARELINQVLAVYPNHPGALHYLTHGWDDPVSAKDVVETAGRYGPAAPDTMHAQHMPCHIFMRAGLWDKCMDVNDRALAVASRLHPEIPLTSSGGHELEFKHYILLQIGRVADAEVVLNQIVEAARAEPDLFINLRQAFLQSRHIVEMQSWSPAPRLPDMLTCATCDDYDMGIDGMAIWVAQGNAMNQVSVGMANAEMGIFDVPATARDRLIDMSNKMAKTYPFLAKEMNMSAIMLDALVLFRQNKVDASLALMTQARQLEREIGFPGYGPQKPVKRSHELYGELLLRSSRAYMGAADAFIESLTNTPKRAQSMLGLARAYAAVGDTDKAAIAYQDLLTQWKQADKNYGPMAEAQAFVNYYNSGDGGDKGKKDTTSGVLTVFVVLLSIAVVALLGAVFHLMGICSCYPYTKCCAQPGTRNKKNVQYNELTYDNDPENLQL